MKKIITLVLVGLAIVAIVLLFTKSSGDIPVADTKTDGGRDASATIDDKKADNDEDAIVITDKDKASGFEDIEEQHRLALGYLRVGDYPKAFEILYELDEQGDTWAQARLGWCYSSGDGVDKNQVKAVEWFRKAAEQGNAEGQSLLATCYSYGIGVEENLDEALKWYQKLIEQSPDSHFAGYAPTTMEGLLRDIEYWKRDRREQIQQIDDKETLIKMAEENGWKYARQLAKERLEELEKSKDADNKSEKPKEAGNESEKQEETGVHYF